jgi:hypothetical protein
MDFGSIHPAVSSFVAIAMAELSPNIKTNEVEELDFSLILKNNVP